MTLKQGFASETSVTTPALTDEAVHVTRAFHLGGYQHVIGPCGPSTNAPLAASLLTSTPT
jgi:hypothetical protein